VTENIGSGQGTIEIEETVVGQIHDRRTIGRRLEGDREFGRAADTIDGAHGKPSRKAALPVGAGVGQNQRRHGLRGEVDDPPELAVEAVMAAVEHVRAVIGIEAQLGAVEHAPRTGDAVGVSPDGRAEKTPRGEIAFEIVMAEHDILTQPGAVARYQRLQRRAIGDDGGLEIVRTAQGDALDRHAVGHRAERRAIDARGRGRRHA
jgi:hypothetical protein